MVVQWPAQSDPTVLDSFTGDKNPRQKAVVTQRQLIDTAEKTVLSDHDG